MINSFSRGTQFRGYFEKLRCPGANDLLFVPREKERERRGGGGRKGERRRIEERESVNLAMIKDSAQY